MTVGHHQTYWGRLQQSMVHRATGSIHVIVTALDTICCNTERMRVSCALALLRTSKIASVGEQGWLFDQ